MQLMRVQLLGLFVLTCISNAGHAADRVIQFPGTTSRIASPSGSYSVLNVDYDNRTPNHALFLVRDKQVGGIPLYSYGRHVDVSWASDSAHLFINDYAGSDYATCLIYDLLSKTMVDIRDVFKKYDSDSPIVFDSDHMYITCSKWVSKAELIIRVSGYGSDQDLSEREYTYILGGKPKQKK